MTIAGVRYIDFPTVRDPRGALTFAEGEKHVPFAIRRVYYVTEMPEEARRGGHAHVALEQIFLALTGTFELTLDDGKNREPFILENPSRGLYVPPRLWRDLRVLKPGTTWLVLASLPYDEVDYIREYDHFKRFVG